jgi:beta-fructofuranosidase
MMLHRRAFLALAGSAVASKALNVSSRTLPQRDVAPELASDSNRPQLHLLPPANWINDPNGPIYWNGHYHMFYQYNPNGAHWGDIHWGHAISDDMVHWKHLPAALAPSPGGPDAAGCFSGTAVVANRQVVLIYTGVRSVPEEQATIKEGARSFLETQCYAVANDPDLCTWTKLPKPVIATPPPGLDVTGFRDPSPWRQGDWWYMVLGSGTVGEGGAVLLYRSRDLQSWEFLHILAQRKGSAAPVLEHAPNREVWECPDFFPLGDKHVLIYSTAGKVYWMAGALDAGMKFHAKDAGVLDHGSFYAAKTQLDRDGNRILWGWIPETRPLDQYKAAGWAGVMSLPRVLTMSSNGRLLLTVAREVDALRGVAQSLTLIQDDVANRRQLAAMRIDDCRAEISCELRPRDEAFRLELCDANATAPSNTARLTVAFDPSHRDRLTINGQSVPLLAARDESIEFRSYIDGSVIEAFVNKNAACTARFYVDGRQKSGLRIHWDGRFGAIERLSICPLSAISHDRLTT